MESYRTEEEQVAALKRWWQENGRSTIAAVVIALSVGFGWQGWQAKELRQQEQASDRYQALLRAMGATATSAAPRIDIEQAEQLKSQFGSTTYAQFAALHLAAQAVRDGNLSDAQAQLRWVLGKAAQGSDIAQIAQLRLARVLAAAGEAEQALTLLAEANAGSYAASYAAARGDILLSAGRNDEAREAYRQALAAVGGAEQGLNLSALQQKLQSLTSVPERTAGESTTAAPDAAAMPAADATANVPEE